MSAADTADRQISATRTFDAPRELVFDLFTDPKHIANWWGPNGFTNTIRTMDVRPGGDWLFTMHGPDGRDYPNHNIFTVVDRPNRLAYRHASPPRHETTIDFIDVGGKTELRWLMVFDTAELREQVVKTFNAVEGLSQTLGRLRAYALEQLGSDNLLVVTRHFDHPATAVFEAWLDPHAAAKFLFATDGGLMQRVEIDPVVGGKFTIVERRGDKDAAHHGTYEEITPPCRLVFSFGDSIVGATSRVVVEITATDNGCDLKLTHQLTPEWAAHADKVRDGWTGILAGLEKTLSQDDTEFVITRTFDAPRELVWRVWTEEKHLVDWFGPKGVSITKAHMEFAPGGHFHYAMGTPDGGEMWGKWVFTEITPPRQIVLISSFSNPAGEVTRAPFNENWPLETLSTTTFTEADGKTTITLKWKPYRATDAERAVFKAGHAGMNGGWGGTFDRLEDYLKTVKG